MRVPIAIRAIPLAMVLVLASACSTPPTQSNSEIDSYGLAWTRFSDTRGMDGRALAEALDQPLLRVTSKMLGEYHASQMLIAIRAPFAEASRTFEARVGQHLGITGSTTDSVNSRRIIDALIDSVYIYDSERARLAIELDQSSVTTVATILRDLQSAPFNVAVMRQSSSVVRVQIIGAATMSGSSGTIVIVSRVDRYEAFVNNWPHVVLPSWTQVNGSVVTVAERNLVRLALHDMGLPSAQMYASIGPYATHRVLLQAVSWLKGP